jgi:deoxyribodipyrimidine photolyase
VVDTNHPSVTIHDGMISMDDKLYKNVYVSELAWREFWQQIAHYFPSTRYLEFLEKYQ